MRSNSAIGIGSGARRTLGRLRPFAALLGLATGISVSAAQCDTYTVATGPAIYSPGTADIGMHSNLAITQIALPFAVSIYGTPYTSANVSTEGFLEFGSNFQSANNLCLPDDRFTGPLLCPYWDNLTTAGAANGQGVFTAVSGSAGSRDFVVEWRTRALVDTGAPNRNFEIIFHENQTYFDFVYSAMPEETFRTQTVGAQGSPTGPDTSYECNPFGNPSLIHAGLSIRFTSLPQPPAGACCALGACTFVCQRQCVTDFSPGVACTPAACPATQPAGQCWSYNVMPGDPTYTPGTTDIGDHSTGNVMTPIALPFAVTVYGSTYTTANVGTSGFIEFGSDTQTTDNPGCLPDENFLGPTIFGYWLSGIWLSDPGSGIFTGVSGAPGSRKFVVEWRASAFVEPTRFEIVFYENQTDFDVLYQAVAAGDQAEKVGVQASPTGPVKIFRCSSSDYELVSGLSLRFSCDTWSGGACCTSGACVIAATAVQCAPTSVFQAGSVCTPGVCPPANDTCANAMDLSSLPVSPFASNTKPIIHDFPATADQTDCGPFARGVWYTYTASAHVAFSYFGFNGTTWAMTPVGTGCTGPVQCLFGTSGVFELNAGQTIKLLETRTADPDGPASTLQPEFRVDSLDPPTNDDCFNPLEFTIDTSRLTAFNAPSGDDIADCTIHRGVWYSFTAPYALVMNFQANDDTIVAFTTDCLLLPECGPIGGSGHVTFDPGDRVLMLVGSPAMNQDPLTSVGLTMNYTTRVACCSHGTCTVLTDSSSCLGTVINGVTCQPDPCPGPPPGQCWQYTIAPVTTIYTPATTDINPFHASDTSLQVPLPFPVTLFGTTVDKLWVNTNGYVQIASDSSGSLSDNTCLPDPRLSVPAIFPFWGDLYITDFQNGQSLFKATVNGNIRSFIIEWRANQEADGAGPPLLSFEMIFYEGQNYFDVVYHTIHGDGHDITVGAQANGMGQVSSYRCPGQGPTLANGLALRFSCSDSMGACCAGTTCSVVAGAAACPSGSSYQGSSTTCGTQANPTTCCRVNFDGIGGVTVQDIFDFLNAWFAGLPSADIDGGGLAVTDIFAFLNAWFAGCG